MSQVSLYCYLLETFGLVLEIHPLNQKLWRCQLMCTVTSLLDLPWKTTQKRLLDCQNVFFYGSCWCAQWIHHWIGFKKLPQNHTRHFEIHPLDQKLWRCLFSLLDWPWKNTPKWLLNSQNLSIGSKDTVKSILILADVYSDLTYWIGLENIPKWFINWAIYVILG